MFIMYDDTQLDLIPNGPHAVASYINGRFANHDAAKSRFPHARHLGISVEGIVPADCYDVEQGDYTPDQVPELYKVARDHGIWRPCFYAQLSGTMQQVKDRLNAVVQQRSDVRLWVASWDKVAILPPGFDAKQFNNRALDRSLDESICASDFFRPLGKPTPSAKREKEPRAEVTYDPDENRWEIHRIEAAVETEKPGA